MPVASESFKSFLWLDVVHLRCSGIMFPGWQHFQMAMKCQFPQSYHPIRMQVDSPLPASARLQDCRLCNRFHVLHFHVRIQPLVTLTLTSSCPCFPLIPAVRKFLLRNHEFDPLFLHFSTSSRINFTLCISPSLSVHRTLFKHTGPGQTLQIHGGNRYVFHTSSGADFLARPLYIYITLKTC